MVAGIHPVGIHGAQILHLQFDQTASQFLFVSQIEGEFVGFELEFADEDVHEELDDGVGR